MTEETGTENHKCSIYCTYNAVFCVLKFHAEQWTSKKIPRREACDNTKASEVDAQLFSAADRGDVAQIEESLAGGANVNFLHFAGSPLTRAARRGHLACVQVLLNHGADVNLPAKFNCQTCMALHTAASNGHCAIVQLLLDHGADVNAKREQGSTPLHDAAKFGHPDIAEVLLQRGAQVNITNARGKTPLYLAVSEGQLDALRWVLEAVVEYYHYRGYCYNSDFFPKKAVEFLLDSQTEVNKLGLPDLQALRVALLQDNLQEIKHILQEQPVSEPQNTRLCLVQILLAAGAKTDIQDEYKAGPLEEAILNNDLACVKLLLENGANVNHPGEKYGIEGILPITCCYGSVEILKILLEHGADVNIQDKRGQTAIHFATRKGLADCVDELLKSGARLDIVDNEGSTPLHLVRTLDCAKLLVTHGADVTVLDKNGRSVLFSAADRTGEAECVKFLIEQGVDPLLKDAAGKTAFDLALNRYYCNSTYEPDDGGVGCVNVLMDHGAKLEMDELNIHKSILRRKLGCVAAMLRSGFDVNSPVLEDKTALHCAIESQCAAAIKLFLDHGADPNLKCHGTSPIYMVLQKEMEEPTRMLLEAGAIVNTETWCSIKALKTFINVLKQMNNLDFTDVNGYPLIQVLCHKSAPERLFNLLLESGADTNITDKRGITALHLVAFQGWKSYANKLLAHGANVNQQNHDGLTALHYCSFQGLTEIAALLLDHEADVNLTDRRGHTPLHIAVVHLEDCQAAELAHLYLDHGAAVDMQDHQGWTPLQLAQTRGQKTTSRLLQDHGAQDSAATIPPPDFEELLIPTITLQENPDPLTDDESEDDYGYGLFD